MHDALVEKVARAIQPVLEQDSEIYWASEYGRPTPDASLTALARAAIAAADDLRLAGVKEGLEMAAEAVDAEYNLRRSHHDAAKAAKLRKEARDFETMAIAHSQSASAIRSLGPRP